MTHTLLLLTGDPAYLTALTGLLATQQLSDDYQAVETLTQGLACLGKRPFTHILADINQLPPDNPALWAPLAQLPLILLARPGQETAVARALEAGAASYLIADPQKQSLTLLPALLRQTAVTPNDNPQDISENQTIVKALAASERHLRTVLTTLPDAVFRLRRNGVFLDCYVNNPEHLVVPPEQFLGKNARETMPPDLAEKTMQALADAQATGKETTFEYDFLVQGNQRSYEARLVPFDVDEYLVVIRDITSQRQTQTALRESEEKYRSLVESYDSAIAMFNPDGKLLYINNIAAQSFGGTPDTLVGKEMFGFFPPEIAESRLQVMRQVAQTGEGLVVEEPAVTQGGTVWYRTSAQPVRDGAGQVTAVLVNAVNITAIKQAETALRESEEKYRSLIESYDSAIAVFNPDGRLLYINNIAAQSFGGTPGALVGKGLSEIFPPQMAGPQLQVLRQVAQTGEGLVLEEAAVIQGETTWYRNSIQPVRDAAGQVTAVLVNAVNITALKRTETALRESERRYRQMFEQHSLPKLIIDHENGVIVSANPAAALFYGYDLAQLTEMTLCDLSHMPPARLLAALGKMVADDLPLIPLQQWRADGSLRDVELFGGPLELDEHLYLYALVSDVTERAQAQRALQEAHDLLERRVLERTAALAESELRYRSLFNQSSDAVFILDTNGKHLEVNQRAGEMLGYSPEEMIGVSAQDIVWPDELGKALNVRARLLAGEKMPIYRRTFRHRDGHALPTEINVEMVRDQHGAPLHIQSIARDISAREAQERQLRFHASLQQAVTDAVISLDNEYRIQSWNAAAEKLYGFSAAEAIGKDEADLLPKEYLDNFTTPAARAYLNEKGFAVGEVRVKRKDGRWLWTMFSASQIRDENGRVEGVVSISRDITHSKEAEIALRLSEKRYRNIVDTQTDLICRYAPDLTLTFVNDAYCRYFGKTREELIACGFFELIPPDERDAVRNYCLELLANPRVVSYEHSVIDAAGKRRWQAWIDTVILDDQGRPQEIQAVGRDITERKEVEEALRQSEERLELAARAGGVGVWDWDIINGTLHWDERMYTLYGLPRQQQNLNYQSWADALHPGDAQEMTSLVEAVLRKEKQYDVEFRIIRPNKEIRHVVGLASLILDDKERPARLVGINLDITNRKETEQRLRNALEKERELSELKTRFVSIASHEFRTPLAAILATTETLGIYRARMDETQIDARLDKIRRQVNHMKALIEDVLQLERIQMGRMEFRPTVNNMNELCRQIIHEFNSQPAYHNRVVCLCDPLPVSTLFDRRLMRQTLNNLISNGLKYSPDDTLVTVNAWVDDAQIYLTVQDRGIGIPPEALPQLYEPFYRANNVGAISGTGLGLPIARQAVEMHDGTLSVESELEVGTTFTIAIPLRQPGSYEDD